MLCKRIFEWHKCLKEGHQDLKDKFITGRHPAGRTEVNLELFTKVVCGNCLLTDGRLTSPLEKVSVLKISQKIWTYRKSNRWGCAVYSAIPGRENYCHVGNTHPIPLSLPRLTFFSSSTLGFILKTLGTSRWHPKEPFQSIKALQRRIDKYIRLKEDIAQWNPYMYLLNPSTRTGCNRWSILN